MVDKGLSIPLYQQIQDGLYRKITAGDYPPGARIPSEHELAAEFGVSRMTARKAIDALVMRGILARTAGKGTFVSDSFVSYSLSTMLSFSKTLTALGYAVKTEILVQDVVPASLAVAEKLKLTPGARVVVVRRLRFVNEQRAAIHTSFMDERLFAGLLQVDLRQESLLAAMKEVSGMRVAYSQDTIRADLVSAEDMVALEVPAGSPVLEVEGIAYTSSGQPIRLTHAVYRGSIFQLVMTNTGERSTVLSVSDEQLMRGVEQDGAEG